MPVLTFRERDPGKVRVYYSVRSVHSVLLTSRPSVLQADTSRQDGPAPSYVRIAC